MPPRPVNDAQREVLDWLAAGGSQDLLRPEMKLSAAALAARGLVKVRRPGGKGRPSSRRRAGITSSTAGTRVRPRRPRGHRLHDHAVQGVLQDQGLRSLPRRRPRRESLS